MNTIEFVGFCSFLAGNKFEIFYFLAKRFLLLTNRRNTIIKTVKKAPAVNRPNRINEEIRVKEVRLIDQNGEQAGIVSIQQALEWQNKQSLILLKLAQMQSRRFVAL